MSDSLAKIGEPPYEKLRNALERIAELENAIAKHKGLSGSGLAHCENETLWRQIEGVKVAPEPFCHTPMKCRETGRCEKETCCNE